MPKIEFPKALKELLSDSELQSPIRAFADQVGEILSDNKLPFFPDYTDHGVDHINSILKTIVELVPKDVWENSKEDSEPRLLCDIDAAVIVGGVLLHDIAMHIRPNGFVELIGKESRFKPLPWFNEAHEDHIPDRPWNELWEAYLSEAKRFGVRELTNIIGEESATSWRFTCLPDKFGEWEQNHFLIIGEFIRRHHARLAHEIAIYGFPGLKAGACPGQFPAIGHEQGLRLASLADLIGLTARSHWKSLRVCQSYLDSSPNYVGTPKPMGTAVIYPMALLRVADYLQIDHQRAPSVLLQLRNPQSPVSVREWAKHRAILNISPASNPRGKMVTVSKDISLILYLQLQELLSGLQAEIDHSTAVLDEIYGNIIPLGLNRLGLATRRIYSNLDKPAFRDFLPFIPERTGFSADPQLLSLLVKPLYGSEPGVGVRELLQNSVDAVRELDVYCQSHRLNKKSLDFAQRNVDIILDFIKQKNGAWILRIQDNGIGMLSHTIQNYFLRAGASFRNSSEWGKEFQDDHGKSTVVRSGRFGIGAFALFLLGNSFQLWTRHVSSQVSQGSKIAARFDTQLIEIERIPDLPVGTTIEVILSDEAVDILRLEKKTYTGWRGLWSQVDWYCWNSPKIIQRVTRGTKVTKLTQSKCVAPFKGTLPPHWAMIKPEGFDAVYWTFKDAPDLVCNGIRITNTDGLNSDYSDCFDWPTADAQFQQPLISIVDSSANLPVDIQRYGLTEYYLPFHDELVRDVMLSFIAHALVCGPQTREEAFSFMRVHPLTPHNISEYGADSARRATFKDDYRNPFELGRLRWCSSESHFVIADPWAYQLLENKSCVVGGRIHLAYERQIPEEIDWHLSPNSLQLAKCNLLGWNSTCRIYRGSEEQEFEEAAKRFYDILRALLDKGAPALGNKVKATRIFALLEKNKLRNRFAAAFEKGWKDLISSKPKYLKEEGDLIVINGRKGNGASSINLSDTMNKFKTSWKEDCDGDSIHQISFVAEIEMGAEKRVTESAIAEVWNECLGERAIPFNTVERGALIEDACKHPELKRHIDAWRKMKKEPA